MENSKAASGSGAVGAIVPAITVCAFYETEQVGGMLGQAQGDRRMGRARLDVFEGGVEAAINRFRTSGSSDLVVIEWQGNGEELFIQLDRLAQECPQGTRVLVIGHRNDVDLYRELMARGVSDYAVAPVSVVQLCTAVARIYSDKADAAHGCTIAFIGASGGVGSSTIAHNVAWAMANDLDVDVLLGDTDVAFGTSGLNFNLETKHQGLLDALQHAGRLDDEMLDRLVTKPHPRLSILCTPAALDAEYELDLPQLERAMEIARALPGYTVFDVPHKWNDWVRGLLKTADHVVVTARPELSSLRNCKNLLGYIKGVRPNDPAPRLILNQVGVPRRAEIKPDKFAAAVENELNAVIAFDPALFSTASNNGQLIGQIAKTSRANRTFRQIASQLVGRRQADAAAPRQKLGLTARVLGRKP